MRKLWLLTRVEFSELLFRLAWYTFPAQSRLYRAMTLAVYEYHKVAADLRGDV